MIHFHKLKLKTRKKEDTFLDITLLKPKHKLRKLSKLEMRK